ncbi:MAG: hypothetical protein NTX03_08985, partial [Bacteroidetes bacterium]|nr:hypothetical protein [Bacteroidota bacterium]
MKFKLCHLLLFFLFSCSLLQAQDPCGILINKSKGLPSNAVYDIFQDTKGYVWLAHDEGLTRYDASRFKSYYSKLQTSRSGSDIHQDKMGRRWYQTFDGYLYNVENDSLHPLIQEKPMGYYRFGIIDESVFALQPKGVDIYSLKAKKRWKQILLPLTQLSYTAQTLTNYYVLSGFLYQISQKGEVRKININFSLSNSRVKMFCFQNILFLVKEEGDVKTFYTLKNGQLTHLFTVKFASAIQNISVAGTAIWACTTHGVYSISAQGELLNKGMAYFPSKSITCVMQDRENNYWFGTANEGVLLVPDLNTQLIKLKEYKPNRIVVSSSLLIATNNDQILSVNPSDFSIKPLVNNAGNQQINQLFYDKEKMRIFYTSQDFNITDRDGKKISSQVMAVKDVCKLNKSYFAFSASGVIGLFSIGKDIEKNEWDSIFKVNAKEKNGITISQIKFGVRGKSVAYNPTNNTVYFATNTGLFALTPRGVTELKTSGKSIYFSKLCSYQNMVYG